MSNDSVHSVGVPPPAAAALGHGANMRRIIRVNRLLSELHHSDVIHALEEALARSGEDRIRIARECGLLEEDVRASNVPDLFQRIGEFGIRVEAAAMERAAKIAEGIAGNADIGEPEGCACWLTECAAAIRAAAKEPHP